MASIPTFQNPQALHCHPDLQNYLGRMKLLYVNLLSLHCWNFMTAWFGDPMLHDSTVKGTPQTLSRTHSGKEQPR